MNKKHYSEYFLFLALAISTVVVYLIAKPFLGWLILAAVFAFLFQPIYKKLLIIFREWERPAAFSTTLIAIILFLLPVSFLGIQIFKESSQLYQTLKGEGGDFVNLMESIINRSRAILPIPSYFELDFGQYAKQGLEILIQNFGAVFSSFAKMLLNVLVFLAAFYFFLKDGSKLKDYFVNLSPLDNADDEFIVSRLKSAISAAVKGNLAIGITQGFLTGVGFTIFGVPNAALWGAVATISAFLPGLGTALVITPAVIFLFLIGDIFGGIGLSVWGITAVGLVDNFLGPRIVGRGMRLHPLAVFIAILGGIALFGPLGFLLGPLAMSVCIALIDIYASLKTRKNKTL